MKKLAKTFSVILCLMLCALTFVACSDPGAPEKSNVQPMYAVERETLEAELTAFMEANPDRTTYTENEQRAALYLINRLYTMGYAHDNVKEQEFFAKEEDSRGQAVTGLKSRNVIAYYRKTDRTEPVKNVIIGAYYDNRYSEAYSGSGALESEGALSNGTGVATLLCIADYLITAKPELDFDVTIVFFGASYISDVGSTAFYKEGMTAEERKSTVLMAELQRLGCDHVYAFSDERQTKREAFFDSIASANGLDIYKITQKSPLLVSVRALDGIPYFRWAHNGVFSPFFNAGIPTLNVIGANWETINIADAETSRGTDISFEKNDNLATLKKQYPDYSVRMAEAATLVIRSLGDSSFLSTMEYDRAHFPQTDLLTTDWIWYLIVFVIMGIVAVVSMFLSTHFAKKYAPAPVQPKRMKMAVFGMDYEDKDSADIFIDMRNGREEIFPGVPNNDPAPRTPFDDIFPQMFGGMADAVARPSEPTEDKQDATIPTEAERPIEPQSTEQPEVKPDESEPQSEAGEAVKPQPAEQPEQYIEQPEQKPAKPKTSRTSTGGVRKSVSAGKSRGAGAKKSADDSTKTDPAKDDE